MNKGDFQGPYWDMQAADVPWRCDVAQTHRGLEGSSEAGFRGTLTVSVVLRAETRPE